MEMSVEWELSKETEVFKENMPPVLICPTQIPHDLIWDRTRAAGVGSWRLTAWDMARWELIGYFVTQVWEFDYVEL
jgi:hypothetical protein